MKGNKENKSRSCSSACKKKENNKIAKRKGKKNKKVLEPVLLPHLPEEIIFEITSRLPLEYRLKFRCVCKSWSIRYNKPKQLVIIGGDNEVYTLDNDLLTSPLLAGKVVRTDKLESSLARTALVTTQTYFVGSCNGIICTSPPNNFPCLWNPTTKEYKLLPRSPSERQGSWGPRIYGFGYDSNSDDYKMIHITSYHPGTHIIPSKVVIYSLRSNAWKEIQRIPYMFDNELIVFGVFCNGALHWLAQSGTDQSISLIRVLIALDVTSEITREIPKPDYSKVNNYDYRRIGVLDGFLCMFFSWFNGFEVWLMKDYGNAESWTMIYFIPKVKLRERQPQQQCLTRIESLKTGEILLEVKLDYVEALVLYNPKKDRARVLKFENNTGRFRSRSVFQTYEKSLIPLHSGTYFGDNVPIPKDR